MISGVFTGEYQNTEPEPEPEPEPKPLKPQKKVVYLKKYPSKATYYGEYNELGRPHGRGVYTYPK